MSNGRVSAIDRLIARKRFLNSVEVDVTKGNQLNGEEKAATEAKPKAKAEIKTTPTQNKVDTKFLFFNFKIKNLKKTKKFKGRSKIRK